MEQNLGLTYPGKCDSCNKRGPRFKFYNQYADPVIDMDLCPQCMSIAFRCMEFFFRTPAGKNAVERHFFLMKQEAEKV